MQPRLSTLRPAIPEARGPPSLALEKILGAKEKVLIFCSYLPTIDLLEEQIKAKFGCIVLKMHGAMDLKAQDVAAKTFQEDPSVQSTPRSVVGSGGIPRQPVAWRSARPWIAEGRVLAAGEFRSLWVSVAPGKRAILYQAASHAPKFNAVVKRTSSRPRGCVR